MKKLLAVQIPWSMSCFHHGKRTLGIIEHIKRELLEIENAPDDPKEWSDVVLLAIDGLWRCLYGRNYSEQVDLINACVNAVREKQLINLAREWNEPVDDSHAVAHKMNERN